MLAKGTRNLSASLSELKNNLSRKNSILESLFMVGLLPKNFPEKDPTTGLYKDILFNK